MGISFDTVEWLGVGIGAKAPVPPIAPLCSSEAAKAIGRFVRVRVCRKCSSEISSSANDLSNRTEQQAASLEQTAAAL